MLYTDRPATSYWSPYIFTPHTRAQVGDHPALKRELARQLANVWLDKRQSIEERARTVERRIVGYAIRDWSREPFGAACHAWAPRVDVPDALSTLCALNFVGQEESGRKNVHICGEAFSDYQGFIEGSLALSKRCARLDFAAATYQMTFENSGALHSLRRPRAIFPAILFAAGSSMACNNFSTISYSPFLTAPRKAL